MSEENRVMQQLKDIGYFDEPAPQLSNQVTRIAGHDVTHVRKGGGVDIYTVHEFGTYEDRITDLGTKAMKIKKCLQDDWGLIGGCPFQLHIRMTADKLTSTIQLIIECKSNLEMNI